MVKRYEIFSATRMSVNISANGEWASYEDHLAEVAALREKIIAIESNQMWTLCIFEGPAPTEYADWHAFVNAPVKQGVRISAIQQSKDSAQQNEN